MQPFSSVIGNQRSSITPGITGRPKKLKEFESRRVAGRVHAAVGWRDYQRWLFTADRSAGSF
jgi:hypothetical protein